MAGAPRAVPGALSSGRPCGWGTTPTFTHEHPVPVSPAWLLLPFHWKPPLFGECGEKRGWGNLQLWPEGQCWPRGPLAEPVPCRTSLSLPGGFRVAVPAPCMWSVKPSGLKRANSSIRHRERDGLRMRWWPAAGLPWIFITSGMSEICRLGERDGAGAGGDAGVKKEGGAEARANSFSSSVSFLCRQE